MTTHKAAFTATIAAPILAVGIYALPASAFVLRESGL